MSLHLKAWRRFGGFELDCDLTLPLGGILGLFGPSGCGKSTLLRIIAGLDRAPSDVLHWQGRDLAALLPEARRIGLVFQDSRLFPHMTVLGNLQLAAGKGRGRWQHEALVVDKWLSVQATSPTVGTTARVRELMAHEAFDLKNPNKVRALIGAFANQNHVNFHRADGLGYRFLADQVQCSDDDQVVL